GEQDCGVDTIGVTEAPQDEHHDQYERERRGPPGGPGPPGEGQEGAHRTEDARGRQKPCEPRAWAEEPVEQDVRGRERSAWPETVGAARSDVVVDVFQIAGLDVVARGRDRRDGDTGRRDRQPWSGGEQEEPGERERGADGLDGGAGEGRDRRAD